MSNFIKKSTLKSFSFASNIATKFNLLNNIENELNDYEKLQKPFQNENNNTKKRKFNEIIEENTNTNTTNNDDDVENELLINSELLASQNLKKKVKLNTSVVIENKSENKAENEDENVNKINKHVELIDDSAYDTVKKK
jgi:hypothetical protein